VISLTDDLKAYAKSRGVDLVGCTSAAAFLLGERIEVDPRTIMPEAESIVTGACYAYCHEEIAPSTPGSPRGRFGPLTRAAPPSCRHATRVIREFLEQRGFAAHWHGDLPAKMAAVRSGIACYGKNSIVHAAGFGSFIELTAVITNARFDCVDLPIQTSDCGHCRACVDACPTGALATPYKLDPSKCICTWLWGDPIPREMRPLVGNHIFRCGFCQNACPKNRALKPRETFPFEIEQKSDCPELIPLLLGDDDRLRQTLPAFVMEAGADTIRRNVAIALGNSGDPAGVPALACALQAPSAKLRGAAAWSLGRLGGPAASAALESALQSEQDDDARNEISWSLSRRTTSES